MHTVMAVAAGNWGRGLMLTRGHGVLVRVDLSGSYIVGEDAALCPSRYSTHGQTPLSGGLWVQGLGVQDYLYGVMPDFVCVRF